MLDTLQRPIRIGLTRTEAPASEPVSLDEAKDWLHVSDSYEDTTIDTLIRAVREKVEDDTGLALITQTWTMSLDRVPASGRIVLPVGPVQSVSSVKSYDTANAESTVATTVYRVDTADLVGRLVLKDGQSWPSDLRPENGLLVTFVAGYGDTAEDVPAALRAAMQLLLGHWFGQRSAVIVGTSAQDVPQAYQALVDQHKLRVLL